MLSSRRYSGAVALLRNGILTILYFLLSANDYIVRKIATTNVLLLGSIFLVTIFDRIRYVLNEFYVWNFIISFLAIQSEILNIMTKGF